MISLFDANILIDVGKCRLLPRLVATVAVRPWQLTEEVFDELGSDVVGRASLRPFVRPSPAWGSPEADLAAVITVGGSGWKSLGVGEASSIAAAVCDPNFEFITWDNSASWRSLHELRGRTNIGHAWLQGLVDHMLLTKNEADVIARTDRTRRHPSWW